MFLKAPDINSSPPWLAPGVNFNEYPLRSGPLWVAVRDALRKALMLSQLFEVHLYATEGALEKHVQGSMEDGELVWLGWFQFDVIRLH